MHGFVTILRETEVNLFAQICLILAAKFGHVAVILAEAYVVTYALL